MFAAPLLAAVLGLSQTVITAVEDPVLPQGALVFAGASAEGDVYIDAGSFGRSDIPNVARGTAVIVGEDDAPLQVVRLWVDCGRRVYQLSTGRRYDAAGRQVGTTVWAPDQPIAPYSAPDRIAAAVCSEDGDFDDLPVLDDYREALERSRAVEQITP